jgi:HD superfamily phosphohydrolase
VKNKPIRDIVHDYIDITPIEQTIIDRPAFQRLRFVTQNSSAYLTFPSNAGTRFPHSLGVMHLSGRMLLRAFENAELKTLVEYLNLAGSYIFSELLPELQVSEKELRVAAISLLGSSCRFGRFADHDYAGSSNEEGDEAGRDRLTNQHYLTVLILWQAVRLCAMIHDIGHLPMSHVFEYALESFQRKARKDSPIASELAQRKKSWERSLTERVRRELLERAKEDPPALHEWVGMQLFKNMLPRSDQGIGRELSVAEHSFCSLVYTIAQLIFVTRHAASDQFADPKAACLGCLHTIISSGLDADRLDYCMRDPQVSGLELGAYDLNRIVDLLTLINATEGTESPTSRNFAIVPSIRSLSAIESFFHQRYLMYKYLIYHHNVARFDGIIKEIVVSFLDEADSGTSSPLEAVFDAFGFFSSNADPATRFEFDKYERFDDCWLRAFFMAVHNSLIELKTRKSERLTRLQLLLDTFLFRRSVHVFSFWKLDAEYYELLRSAREEASDPAIENISDDEFRLNFRKQIDADVHGFFDTFEQTLKSEFMDVIPIGRSVKPKGIGPDNFKLLSKDGEGRNALLAVKDVSAYLRSLDTTGDLVPSIHLSVVCRDIKSPKELSRAKQKAMTKAVRKIVATQVTTTLAAQSKIEGNALAKEKLND